MIKSSVAMFMAEVMYKSLREENNTDEPLFEFLFHAIQILDLDDEKTPNFPLYFLLQLSRYLGFFPKGTYTESTNGFDSREGLFETYDKRNPFQIEPFLSEKISQLLACDFNEMNTVKLVYAERKQLLENVVEFYQHHTEGFSELKSHIVLGEVLM
jgi:DNA repair protein RecO (recombination protein O)